MDSRPDCNLLGQSNWMKQSGRYLNYPPTSSHNGRNDAYAAMGETPISHVCNQRTKAA